MSDATAVLEAKSLKKYFPVGARVFGRVRGWVKAVDDVSISIRRGQTLALVGESGCGKTTTGRLLLLLEKPTAGSIFFRSRIADGLRGRALKDFRSSVQAVFQDPYSSLDPRMRVGQSISEPVEGKGGLSKAEIEDRVSTILKDVGLQIAAKDLFPHEFSGGQRQRIAIARALAPRPDVIILDEPVSALDVSIGAQIMNLLKDIQDRSGVGYLLIAHNLGTVRYMSTEVAVMYLGEVIEHSTTEELYRHPLHPYTQALLRAALPFRPDSRVAPVITGEVSSAFNPPSGCRFHPRCPLTRADCSSTKPILREMSVGHWVACHL